MISRVLYWFPIVLLPVCNVITAVVGKQRFTASISWILGAIVEELFFRFFLLKVIFLPRISPIRAIIINSVLFAAMHLFNLRGGQTVEQTLLQVFYAFSFSIWAGAVTWKVTWLIPLIVHVLLNLTAGEETSWVSLIVSGIVLVDGVMLLIGNDGRLAD